MPRGLGSGRRRRGPVFGTEKHGNTSFNTSSKGALPQACIGENCGMNTVNRLQLTCQNPAMARDRIKANLGAETNAQPKSNTLFSHFMQCNKSLRSEQRIWKIEVAFQLDAMWHFVGRFANIFGRVLRVWCCVTLWQIKKPARAGSFLEGQALLRPGTLSLRKRVERANPGRDF